MSAESPWESDALFVDAMSRVCRVVTMQVPQMKCGGGELLSLVSLQVVVLLLLGVWLRHWSFVGIDGATAVGRATRQEVRRESLFFRFAGGAVCERLRRAAGCGCVCGNAAAHPCLGTICEVCLPTVARGPAQAGLTGDR